MSLKEEVVLDTDAVLEERILFDNLSEVDVLSFIFFFVILTLSLLLHKLIIFVVLFVFILVYISLKLLE